MGLGEGQLLHLLFAAGSFSLPSQSQAAAQVGCVKAAEPVVGCHCLKDWEMMAYITYSFDIAGRNRLIFFGNRPDEKLIVHGKII